MATHSMTFESNKKTANITVFFDVSCGAKKKEIKEKAWNALAQTEGVNPETMKRDYTPLI